MDRNLSSKAVLCLDVGNTRVKAGLFRYHRLRTTVAYPRDTSPEDSAWRWLRRQRIDAVVRVRTAPLPAFWQRYLDALAVPVLRFPAEVEPPVRTQYQRPEQLGADRLAACCGAIRLYPGRAALVLDAGSCLTYDWVDAQGWHGGGGISPGLRMRLQAMHQFTAALPEVEPGGFPPPLVPTNTREALLAGAWRGMAHEIEALIGRFRQRFGSFKTLLTGGDAPHLTPLLESRIFVHPNLNLHGLYQSLPAHDS